MSVDLGTGDGRAVLARALVDPRALVIGVDAAPAAMAEASRRAQRRGPANAVFLAAGVEGLADTPLAGVADLVTVTFPWGSLLRGALGLDDPATAGIAAVLAARGTLQVLTSVRPSDRLPDVSSIDERAAPAIAAAWRRAGVDLVAMRPATATEIAAAGSSWGRRLRATTARDSGRSVWRLDGVARRVARRAG